MSSLAAKAMAKSRASSSGQSAVPAPVTPSVVGQAMRKAAGKKVSSGEAPAASKRAEIAEEERKRREARVVQLTESAERKVEEQKERKATFRRKDTPHAKRAPVPVTPEDEESSESDAFESPIRSVDSSSSARKNLLATLEKSESKSDSEGKKRRRARSQSGDNERRSSSAEKAAAKRTEALSDSKSNLQRLIFRVAFALICAICFYLVQKNLWPVLEVPSSVADSHLALPGTALKRYISSAPATDSKAAGMHNLRESLKLAINSEFNEDLTTQQLWDMYMETRARNGKLAVAAGTLFGFLVAGALM